MGNRRTVRTLILAWVYGLICGLGIASSVVGLLRGEPMPGVVWPALVPLLFAPLLILHVIGTNKAQKVP